MKRLLGFACVCLCAASAVTACSKKPAEHASIAPSGPAASAAPAAAAMPDVGRVATRKVSTQGMGDTEEQALLDALKTAVMEVNGGAVGVADFSVHASADAHFAAHDSTGHEGSIDASLRSNDFMHAVAMQSGGVIDHFLITKVDTPASGQKSYTVDVDAYIRVFHAATASARKLKVVVAPVHASQESFDIGGLRVPAASLCADITQRLTRALVQSGRFDVLDRSGDPAAAQELRLIGSGQTDKRELAKLNQTIPADVVVAGSLDTLAYTRHSQRLAISDRPLVSYDGQWAFSDKVINVTTSELMNDGSFSGVFPSVAPTTMPVQVDARGMLTAAENQIVSDAVAQLIRALYPITLLAVQGPTLVFSQGGESLQTGRAYQLMEAGQLIKDPQTGEIIGHVTTPVGEVLIDRVGAKLSYGHLLSAGTASLPTNGAVRIGNPVAAASPGQHAHEAKASASDHAAPASAPSADRTPATAAATVPAHAPQPVLRKDDSRSEASLGPTPSPAKHDSNW